MAKNNLISIFFSSWGSKKGWINFRQSRVPNVDVPFYFNSNPNTAKYAQGGLGAHKVGVKQQKWLNFVTFQSYWGTSRDFTSSDFRFVLKNTIASGLIFSLWTLRHPAPPPLPMLKNIKKAVINWEQKLILLLQNRSKALSYKQFLKEKKTDLTSKWGEQTVAWARTHCRQQMNRMCHEKWGRNFSGCTFLKASKFCEHKRSIHGTIYQWF